MDRQGRIDFQEAARVGLGYIRSWLPQGRMSGDEWVTRNPKRQDNKPGSFKINTRTGAWADFARNEKGGDAVSLFAYLNDISQAEAAKEILQKYGNGFASRASTPPQDEKPQVRVIVPAPADAEKPKGYHPVYGTPKTIWYWHNRDGATVFCTARYEYTDPEAPEKGLQKDVMPISWCYDPEKGRELWKFKRPPVPLPLYDLHRFDAEPEAPVLIVEGEKCVEAAKPFLPGWIVTTWQGGTNNVRKSDWSVLEGRTVVIWPDNDFEKKDKDGNVLPPDEQPGRKAALEIMSITRNFCRIRIMKVPPGHPDGWDIADAIEEGWTDDDIKAAIESKPVTSATIYPFRSLGFDHDTYYFMSGRTNQVLPLTGSQLSKRTMTMLAPLEFWEREFPSKSGADWDQAADRLIEMAAQAGPYDKGRVRGRGAWWDSGRTVLHLGDRLLVNGKTDSLMTFDSRYLYETRPAIGTPDAPPASVEESSELLKLAKRFLWEGPLDAHFMAGWAVVAPICGALTWRPHLWLTGPSGSGKSWVQNYFLKLLLGDQAVYAMGKSSEAGIRQNLAGDALPVVIDEAEGKDQRSRENIQNMLFMARQASSEGEGVIYRGTTSGKSMEFIIRSCFMFASIGVGTQDHADETRITVCTLRADMSEGRKVRWEKLEADTKQLLSKQFCDSIRSRTIQMIPVIRENARVFSRAAAAVLGNQRIGDQVGALLAGAYSLVSDYVISDEDARKWLEEHKEQLSEQRQQQETKDEELCLQTLLQSTVKAQTDTGMTEPTVGELVSRAAGKVTPGMKLSAEEADQVLRRHGLRVMPLMTADGPRPFLFAANQHDRLRAILRDTPWATNYHRILRRLPYARAYDYIRYVPGVRARSTQLSLDSILIDDPDPTE